MVLPDQNILKYLKSIPWLLELSPRQVERLTELATYQEIAAETVLFEEGSPERYLYLLLAGEMCMDMHIPSRGNLCVYTAEPLDIIGWSALTPVVRGRTVSARAIQPCSLLAFESKALFDLCEKDHDIGFFIMRRLSNVAASYLLTTRLTLFDLLLRKSAASVYHSME